MLGGWGAESLSCSLLLSILISLKGLELPPDSLPSSQTHQWGHFYQKETMGPTSPPPELVVTPTVSWNRLL